MAVSTQPLISVIVPVYNVERYLDQCVESLIGQTYERLEIILVDDGSTDSSGEQCNAWANRDNRIRAVRQCNAGLAAARNTGLDLAKGEYIGFVDSDDYVLPDMFGTLLHNLQESTPTCRSSRTNGKTLTAAPTATLFPTRKSS